MPQDSLATTPRETSGIGALYTTQEVATVLRVSQRTVQDWIRSGELTAVRYGRLLRIRQADLVAFGEVLPRRTATAPGAHGTPDDAGGPEG